MRVSFISLSLSKSSRPRCGKPSIESRNPEEEMEGDSPGAALSTLITLLQDKTSPRRYNLVGSRHRFKEASFSQGKGMAAEAFGRRRSRRLV